MEIILHISNYMYSEFNDDYSSHSTVSFAINSNRNCCYSINLYKEKNKITSYIDIDILYNHFYAGTIDSINFKYYNV